MIHNIQIEGTPDTHPERPIYDAKELADGKLADILHVKSHHTEVFDVMNPDDRANYDRLYVELSDYSKKGSVYVISNRMETLTRDDGSTGWFRYVEWIEYDISEVLGA